MPNDKLGPNQNVAGFMQCPQKKNKKLKWNSNQISKDNTNKLNIGQTFIFSAFLIFTGRETYFPGGNSQYSPAVIPATGFFPTNPA